MSPQAETDFPAGHPGRADFDPHSPEAKEWVRKNVAPLGDRDFPVDHPGAADTPGNLNALEWHAGEDPHNPHREPFTGRTAEQAAGVAALSALASKAAAESPVLQPLDAAEVNAALDSKRVEVNRDLLTPDEFREVIAQVQTRPRDPVSVEDARAKVEKQHLALQTLLGRGYTRNSALEVIAREGADRILGIAAVGSK